MNKKFNRKTLATFIITTLLFFPLACIYYSIGMIEKKLDQKSNIVMNDIEDKAAVLLKYLLRSYGNFDNNYDDLTEAQQKMKNSITQLSNELFDQQGTLTKEASELEKYFIDVLVRIDRYKVEHAKKINALRYLTNLYRQLQVTDGDSEKILNQQLMKHVEALMLLTMNLSIFQDQTFYDQAEDIIIELTTAIALLDQSSQVRFYNFITNSEIFLHHSENIRTTLEFLMHEDYSLLLNVMNQQLSQFQILEQKNKQRLEQKLSYYVLFLLVIVLCLIFNRSKIIAKTLKHQEMSERDFLTKLMNRRGIIRHIEKSLSDSKSIGFVMFIDLDGFKAVNDHLGHSFGDTTLCTIADRLTHQVSGSDHRDFTHNVARLGGDEFITLVTNATSDNVHQIADELSKKTLALCSEQISSELNQYPISASIGVAFFPTDSSDLTELLHFADKAMYVSKKNGKNCCNYYQKNKR